MEDFRVTYKTALAIDTLVYLQSQYRKYGRRKLCQTSEIYKELDTFIHMTSYQNLIKNMVHKGYLVGVRGRTGGVIAARDVYTYGELFVDLDDPKRDLNSRFYTNLKEYFKRKYIRM